MTFVSPRYLCRWLDVFGSWCKKRRLFRDAAPEQRSDVEMSNALLTRYFSEYHDDLQLVSRPRWWAPIVNAMIGESYGSINLRDDSKPDALEHSLSFIITFCKLQKQPTDVKIIIQGVLWCLNERQVERPIVQALIIIVV